MEWSMIIWYYLSGLDCSQAHSKKHLKTRAVLAFIAIQVGCFLVIGLLGFWKIKVATNLCCFGDTPKVRPNCWIYDGQTSQHPGIQLLFSYPRDPGSPNVRGWLDWGVLHHLRNAKYFFGSMVHHSQVTVSQDPGWALRWKLGWFFSHFWTHESMGSPSPQWPTRLTQEQRADVCGAWIFPLHRRVPANHTSALICRKSGLRPCKVLSDCAWGTLKTS